MPVIGTRTAAAEGFGKRARLQGAGQRPGPLAGMHANQAGARPSADRGTWHNPHHMEDQQLAAAFKALRDSTRLGICKMIRASDSICACKILEGLDVAQPTLSRHMKQLCSAGLVTSTKRGKWMHCSANPEAAQALAAFLQ